MQAPEEQSPSDQDKHHPRLAKSFSQVAAATVASKVVGLIRDVIVGKAYGTTIVADAYQYAFLLTGNFFVMFGGLGGPFDTCTVTVLDSKSEEQRPAILWKLLKSTFRWLALLTLIAYAAAPILIPIGATFYKPRQGMTLTVAQSQTLLGHELFLQLNIMLPMLIIAGLLGILYGVSHLKNKIVLPSLAPAIQSVVIILFVGAAWLKFGITSRLKS